MAWSSDTVYACMNEGIPGSPRLVFTQGVTFTGNIYLTPNTLFGMYSGQSIKHFSNALEYVATALNETFFVPDTVIDGVAKWNIVKAANSGYCEIQFQDANGVPVKTSSEQLYFDPAWAVAGVSSHYNYYGVLGKDENNDFQFGAMQPLDLVLAADPLSNNIYVAMMSTHSAAAAALGLWAANPMWVDNMSPSAKLNNGNAEAYIDALFDGKYDALNGMIGAYGSAGGGGGGQFRPSYGIPVPQLPTISVCDTGMVSLYSVNNAQMQAFAAYMWDNNFYNSIVKNFQSPMDNIISLQMIPLSVYQLSGSAGNISIGNLDSGLPSQKKLTTSYYEINCGTIKVNEYYKSFADYAPYVQMHLSLPFCGICEISPDDCMNGYINVVYHVDVFSGSCVAFVRCYTNGVWTVLQQHSGNIIAQFPVTGRDYSKVYIGAINSIASLAQRNLTGAINSAANIKPAYQRSGGVTSVAGLMGVRVPYLIISTPKYILAQNFREVKGYTSNLTVKIGDQSGYLQARADNSELSGIGCTKQEEDMIRDLLSEGIYV